MPSAMEAPRRARKAFQQNEPEVNAARWSRGHFLWILRDLLTEI